MFITEKFIWSMEKVFRNFKSLKVPEYGQIFYKNLRRNFAMRRIESPNYDSN